MTNTYASFPEKRLREEYEKAIDELTINPENRLRRKVEKLEIGKNQFDQLAGQVRALEKRVDRAKSM